tara:strand:+ start:721 stop:1053 length:333 start_codon:yes stop_codon:yes gene_type:complete
MWKEILKIDMEEARRLGDKYAPEDMEEGKKDQVRANLEKVKPAIMIALQKYGMPDIDGMESRNLRYTLSMLLKDLPLAPSLFGSNSNKARRENKRIIENYLDRLERDLLM